MPRNTVPTKCFKYVLAEERIKLAHDVAREWQGGCRLCKWCNCGNGRCDVGWGKGRGLDVVLGNGVIGGGGSEWQKADSIVALGCFHSDKMYYGLLLRRIALKHKRLKSLRAANFKGPLVLLSSAFIITLPRVPIYKNTLSSAGKGNFLPIEVVNWGTVRPECRTTAVELRCSLPKIRMAANTRVRYYIS